jgi:N-acyl amino acid synthase of PEP-CTERM/exosortase system
LFSPVVAEGSVLYRQFSSIVEGFLSFFDVRLATMPAQREQLARMRDRVYCEEFGYENAADFPSRLETDEFDEYSHHCMVIPRRSGRLAGCVRLVCASETQPLPIHKYCLDSIYTDYAETLLTDRENICEFSRLSVDSDFRRRRGEDHTQIGEFDALDCCGDPDFWCGRRVTAWSITDTGPRTISLQSWP